VITNKSDISLALAVWLLHDEYDHITNKGKYISVTSAMKPLRHILLPRRMDPSDNLIDVEDFIAKSMGHALHDSVEKAWTHGYARSLRLLGYPDSLIERIRINPTDDEASSWGGNSSIIPIYIEQRLFREIDGWTVGGKFDFITDGIIQDQKSTSAYSWLLGSRDNDYQLQMSLYRWLDAGQPLRKITEDFGRINFIFTDWQKMQAKSNPNYPQKKVEFKEISLLSLDETEAWLRAKLSLIDKYKDTPEEKLPECSEEELWRSETIYKYYSDPTKTSGRSTKNFDDLTEAMAMQATKGKGIVKTVPGEPKRCGYCEAFTICSQKDRYFTP
jgi:hypothetical protein